MALIKFDDYRNIYQVEGFQKEFEEVLDETDTNGRYHKWLRRKLSVLEANGYGGLIDRDFEKIEDTNPKLYAIRYPKSKKNPRIVYAYVDNGEVILLHTFLEKSKKTSSDYRAAIKIATNRLKSLQE